MELVNLEFGSVQKRYNAQLGIKGNIHMKIEKEQSNTFPEIAVTNFYFQHPGHLEFGSVQKGIMHN